MPSLIDCNRQNKVRAVRAARTERKLWIARDSLRTVSTLCGVAWRRMRRAEMETVNNNRARGNLRAGSRVKRKVSSKDNKVSKDNRVNRVRDSSRVELRMADRRAVSQPA